MGRFATTPIDEVTIQAIADEVGMTPAAVYYHFASKEQVLLEGMTQFRDGLLHETRSALASHAGSGPATTAPDLGRVVEHLLLWIAARPAPATVWFVRSVGLNMQVEALRRQTRVTLVELLRDGVHRGRGRGARDEAGVLAVATVSLVETAGASVLNDDPDLARLGARRAATVAAEAGRIADRMAGRTTLVARTRRSRS